MATEERPTETLELSDVVDQMLEDDQLRGRVKAGVEARLAPFEALLSNTAATLSKAQDVIRRARARRRDTPTRVDGQKSSPAEGAHAAPNKTKLEGDGGN